MHGVEEREIMDQTGHKPETMIRKYIRDRELLRNNPAGRVDFSLAAHERPRATRSSLH